MAISGGGINTAIVRVEVSIDDYEKATTILNEDKRRLTLGPWTCNQCSESNDSTFDLCWNCGSVRDTDSDLP